MPRAALHRHPANAQRRIALAFAAASIGCGAGGLPIVVGEWRSEAIIAAMRSGDASTRGEILERFADTPPGALPDRAEAALAQIALATAGETQDAGLHQLYLTRASELIGPLRTRRGDWAPSLILATELAFATTSANTGSGAPMPAQALADYAASYRAAPFLRQEARWRIAFGAQGWQRLDRATRQHMIDEAVWLTQYDNTQRAGIEADIGDSPAGVAYQLALARAAERTPYARAFRPRAANRRPAVRGPSSAPKGCWQARRYPAHSGRYPPCPPPAPPVPPAPSPAR